MRLMNWNIEHMNSWWTSDDPPQVRPSFDGRGIPPPITDVPDLLDRVANVIRSVDPDIVTIQEGAGSAELDQFFNQHVDDTGAGVWTIVSGGTSQALAVAARTDRGIVTGLQPGPEIVADVDLTARFVADVEPEPDPLDDPELDEAFFARKPLPVVVQAHGADILILNNHLKSKFVNDGRQRWEAGGQERKEFIRLALIARRRISAEAYRIRKYLDALVDHVPSAAIVVTGDLNDGPGADFFEENYLTHSVVDRVFGSIFFPQRRLSHALLDRGITDPTAEFFDFVVGENRQLFLDHIGIDQFFDDHWPDWISQVEHDHSDANTIDDPPRHERDQLPSDHRPVIVELTPAAGAPVPAPLPTAWTLEADSLFKWQRQAIGTPIAQALLPVEVRDELARRAIQALGAQSGVSAARHEDLLEQSVRAVVLRLNPQSTTNDIDTVVAAVCDDGPAFPFC